MEKDKKANEKRRVRKKDVRKAKNVTLKKTFNKKILWLPIAILVIAGIYFIYQMALSNFGSKPEILYTEAETTSSISFKSTLYFNSIDGLHAISASGKDVNTDINSTISPFIKGMKEPVFEKGEKNVIVYDILGKTAIVYDERGIIVPLTYDKQIIKAKMNKKGQFVVILNEDGAKATVKAYDEKGIEKLAWFSGSGYVVDASINDSKNTMAVLVNDVVSGIVTSKLLFFQLDNPEPMSGKMINDKAAYFVSYFGSNALVICDNGLYAFTDNGDFSQACDFSGRKVRDFKSFISGDMLISYENTAEENYQIEVYNIKGKLISSYTTPAYMSIVDITEDKFLVSKRKEVASYSKKGKLLKTVSSDYEVKTASYFDNKIAIIGFDRITVK